MLKLAIQGNYQDVINSRRRAYLTALRGASEDSSNVTKQEIRTDIRRSGLGNRLAGTVQDKIYPARGLSFSPVALIYSKAPHILSTHADGTTVRPRLASRIWIPIEGGPAANMRIRRGVDRMDAFIDRYGTDALKIVNIPGRNPIAVMRMLRTDAGQFRKIRALKPLKQRQGPRIGKGNLVDVPVFTLARAVRHQQRLNTRQIMVRGQRRHPARVAFHLSRRLAESEQDTAIRS